MFRVVIYYGLMKLTGKKDFICHAGERPVQNVKSGKDANGDFGECNINRM